MWTVENHDEKLFRRRIQTKEWYDKRLRKPVRFLINFQKAQIQIAHDNFITGCNFIKSRITGVNVFWGALQIFHSVVHHFHPKYRWTVWYHSQFFNSRGDCCFGISDTSKI